MGGLGSGRGYVKPVKKTVGQYASISTTELRTHGVFTAKEKEPVKWSQKPDQGRLPQVAAYTVGDKAVIVAVYHDDQNKLRTAEAVITLCWTECHFGGKRPWFLCPVSHEGDEPCRARVRSLP